MRTRQIRGMAVVATYQSKIDAGCEDILDSWFTTTKAAKERLSAQVARYPGVKFYLTPIVAWQDSEYEHWHVKRA